MRPALLLLGSLAGAPLHAQVSAWSAEGASPVEFFGRAVAVLDDIDGDGWLDLAVGAPGATGKAGAVRFLSGRDGSLLHQVAGTYANGRLGWALAAVDDLDGDGLRDVLAGEPHTDGTSAGTAVAAYVLSSASGARLRTLTPPLGAVHLGWSVCLAGDLNGDGVAELAAGDIAQGRLHVFDGASGAWFTSVGPEVSFYDAWSCAGTVDVDGDGIPDLAMGGKDSIPGFGAGHVTLYSGASGAKLWQRLGQFGEELGAALDWTGDLDGDGVPDLLTGSADYGSFGSAGKGWGRILSGATGALLRTSPKAGFGFGAEVAGLPDLDGDGSLDYAIAQAEIESTWAPATAVHVYSLASGAELAVLDGDGSGDAFGQSLAGTDLNGDGLGELIVGAPHRDGPGGTDAGALTLYTFCPGAQVYCSAKPNSLGCSPTIQGVGQPSGSLVSVFRIKAKQVLSNKAGLLIYGHAAAALPFQGGTLCIAPPIRRTPVQASGGNPLPTDCSGIYSLDFNARIRSGVDPALQSGVKTCAQYWSRDVGASFGTGLSDAIAFTICL